MISCLCDPHQALREDCRCTAIPEPITQPHCCDFFNTLGATDNPEVRQHFYEKRRVEPVENVKLIICRHACDHFGDVLQWCPVIQRWGICQKTTLTILGFLNSTLCWWHHSECSFTIASPGLWRSSDSLMVLLTFNLNSSHWHVMLSSDNKDISRLLLQPLSPMSSRILHLQLRPRRSFLHSTISQMRATTIFQTEESFPNLGDDLNVVLAFSGCGDEKSLCLWLS